MQNIKNKISIFVWFVAIILTMIGIYIMYKDRSQVTASNIFIIAVLIIALFDVYLFRSYKNTDVQIP